MLVMGGQTPADRLIHRSAWKGYSQNFALTAFSSAFPEQVVSDELQ
jgi:hypothetical protein